MPIRGLLSQLTSTQVQLQVATSSDGGATESDVITSVIAPSGVSGGASYGFFDFWVDERGGTADGSGKTNYLLLTFGLVSPGLVVPHLWNSTDDGLQSWKEIILPAELSSPGGQTPTVWSAILVHATGTLVIAGHDNVGVTAVWRQASGSSVWTKDSKDFAGVSLAPTMTLAEADDGSLFLVVNAGLYKSTDDGNSWPVLKPAGTGPQAFLKYFTAKGASGLGLPSMFAQFVGMPGPSVSKDNGQTWTPLTGLSGALAGGSRRSWVARLPDGTYLVATTSGLFHSSDAAGVSYQQEALPSGFSSLESLATGDNFAWLVLDIASNTRNGPYLYQRKAAGSLVLLDTAADHGSYNIDNIGVANFEYYTQYGVGPTTFWGVDTLTPVSQALFDTVKSQKGAVSPAFWGRYIGFIESQAQGFSSLSQPEVAVLHGNLCKILLIYNDTYSYRDANGNIILVSNYIDGVFHAWQAIRYIAQNNLAVPQNKSVWIYLDTEIKAGIPDLTVDFYRGWLDAMLGSPYGGAGGVYGNTAVVQDSHFNAPYCKAYNTGISFMQVDIPSICQLKQYFGNPVGGGQPSPGRKAMAGGTNGFPGFTELTETMLPSESEVIYVLWEIAPGPNAIWSGGTWTVRLNVTSPNRFITWNGVEIVHVDQNCNSIEELGNLDGQAVSLKSTGVLNMVVAGIAPASTPAPVDKVLLLLSFSNSSKNQSESFGYIPNQLVDSPFARVGAFVYANQPEPDSIHCDITYRLFSPTPPDTCKARAVIYQYTENCTVSVSGKPIPIDYDTADATGLASMW